MSFSRPMSTTHKKLKDLPCRIFDEDRNMVEFKGHKLVIENRYYGEIITCLICGQAENYMTFSEDGKA